jgi:hypothetical protein
LGNYSFLQTKSIEEENVEEKKPGEEIEILSSPTMLSKLMLHSLRAPTLHNEKGQIP